MSEYTRSPNPNKLYRSSTNRYLAGVCAGIAERMGWDPTVVRIAVVISILSGFMSGIVLIGYLVCWIILPKRTFRSDLTPEEDEFWRSVSDRPKTTFSNLKYKFMDLEDRLRGLEKTVTSDEWQLRRKFKDLES